MASTVRIIERMEIQQIVLVVHIALRGSGSLASYCHSNSHSFHSVYTVQDTYSNDA